MICTNQNKMRYTRLTELYHSYLDLAALRIQVGVPLDDMPLGSGPHICFELAVGQVRHHQLREHLLVLNEASLAIDVALLPRTIALVITFACSLRSQRQALLPGIADVLGEAHFLSAHHHARIEPDQPSPSQHHGHHRLLLDAYDGRGTKPENGLTSIRRLWAFAGWLGRERLNDGLGSRN